MCCPQHGPRLNFTLGHLRPNRYCRRSLRPSVRYSHEWYHMSVGNAFQLTGPLWGESTSEYWILLTNASTVESVRMPWCHPAWLSKRHKGISSSDKTWARFLSLAQSKLRLCSANHRAGYFSNLTCDWLSMVWAYSKQETENGPRSKVQSFCFRAICWTHDS